MESLTPQTKQIKAVGLLSGGLDSTIAAAIIKNLGVEVHAVYFGMPWGCCDKQTALQAAEKMGIKFVPLQLDERYLDVVQNAKHGYGSAMNPCIDCRIHMFSRAQKYMAAIGGEFVFTGEVLGQRPMSQKRESMRIIEKESNLEGRLLRPLSAQHLDPTIPEQQGLIDRDKLLNLSGRSRTEQLRLAEELGITDYLPPAGGCLLTDPNFARRMKDTLAHGYRNFRETIALKWGRHFRISQDFKVVLGRDEEENINLTSFAYPDDYRMELLDRKGPALILKGENPSPEILSICAGLIQRFSKQKDAPPVEAQYFQIKTKDAIQKILARKLEEQEVSRMTI